MKEFKAQDPLKGYALLHFLVCFSPLFLLDAMLFIFFRELEWDHIAILMFIMAITVLAVIEKFQMKQMMYTITNESIRTKRTSFLGQVREIPFDKIKGIEVIPPAKNIFQGLFSTLKLDLFWGKGRRSIGNFTSTGIYRDIVLVHTDYLKGFGSQGLSYTFSPIDVKGFEATLEESLKKFKSKK